MPVHSSIELEFRTVSFWGEGKTGEKNLSEQSREAKHKLWWNEMIKHFTKEHEKQPRKPTETFQEECKNKLDRLVHESTFHF